VDQYFALYWKDITCFVDFCRTSPADTSNAGFAPYNADRPRYIDSLVVKEYGAPETGINDPLVQNPTTNSLYCFPSPPLPLSGFFPGRLSFLTFSVSSASPSGPFLLSLCGE